MKPLALGGLVVVALLLDVSIRLAIAHDVIRSNASVVRACEVTRSEVERLNERIIATERTAL